MSERVAVTGLGVVCALGTDPRRVFAALCAGESGVRPGQRWRNEGVQHVEAAEVDRAAVRARLDRDERALPWATQMALVAGRGALADAGLEPVLGDGGLFVNTILGAPATLEGQTFEWGEETFDRRALVEQHAHGSRVAALARGLGGRGPVLCTVIPCAGNTTLGAALDFVRGGSERVALAGGMEEISVGSYCAFHQIRVLADVCRPFDRRRAGLVIGEGAAFLVLESAARARARSARIYAELLAIGNANDAYDLVAPHPGGEGAVLALRRAIAGAGLSPSDVDYVNAHGTGTELNDAAEAEAMCEVFGQALAGVRMSSTKGATGHALGAASAIEAVVTTLAVEEGRAPPTWGLEEPDEALGLPPSTLAAAEPAPIRVALSSGFGLGGNDSVAVFGAPGEGAPVHAQVPVYVRGVALIGAGSLDPAEVRGAVRAGTPWTRAQARIDFDVRELLGRKRLRHADRVTEIVGAAVLPQLPGWPAVDGTAAGVVVGVAHPSYHSALAVMRRLQAGGAPRLNPGAVPHSTSNSTASWLAIRTGVAGLNATVATGDCAGLDAAAFAAGEVRCGRLATAMVAGACGWGKELWRALGRAGRTGAAEACGALWLDRSPDGALAEVSATAAAFDPVEPAVASLRCGAEALRGARLEVAELVIGSRLGPGSEELGAVSLSLAPVLGDTIAAGGALAAALAADRIAAGEIGSALVLATSPEGYASALVLVAPSPLHWS